MTGNSMLHSVLKQWTYHPTSKWHNGQHMSIASNIPKAWRSTTHLRLKDLQQLSITEAHSEDQTATPIIRDDVVARGWKITFARFQLSHYAFDARTMSVVGRQIIDMRWRWGLRSVQVFGTVIICDEYPFEYGNITANAFWVESSIDEWWMNRRWP